MTIKMYFQQTYSILWRCHRKKRIYIDKNHFFGPDWHRSHLGFDHFLNEAAPFSFFTYKSINLNYNTPLGFWIDFRHIIDINGFELAQISLSINSPYSQEKTCGGDKWQSPICRSIFNGPEVKRSLDKNSVSFCADIPNASSDFSLFSMICQDEC